MTSESRIQAPTGEKKILLHVCCAPCSCSIIQRLTQIESELTVFFYNPNIYPREEYEKRKQEVIRFIHQKNIPFVDADHEIDRWFEAIKGHEEDPERGERCDLCFEMRLGKTAEYASKHHFKVFATSLGISRWKDLEQVNRAGEKTAALFPGLTYWAQNWRVGGGRELMDEIVKEQQIYRQRYCGCLYSLRESLRRGLDRFSGDRSAKPNI
jgi:predicted adenine nucleotide alpha hydrolase (AANH) superfamily ATPase